MGESINVDYCENTEEVLSSDVLWEIGIRIIKKMDKYSTEYYTDIIEKLKNKEEINKQEYDDIVEFLSSEEFISQAKKFYSKTKINIDLDVIFNLNQTDSKYVINDDSLSHLSFDNIISSVGKYVAAALAKNLANTGEIGQIYRIEGQKYICIDLDSNKILCKLLYDRETSKGTIFMVETTEKHKGVVLENGEVIIPMGDFVLIDYTVDEENERFHLTKKDKEGNMLYGLLNIDGEDIYGGCKRREVIKTIKASNGEEYQLVREGDKQGLIKEDGTGVYGGCKWREVIKTIKASNGEEYMLVKSGERQGLVKKDGTEVYGGVQRVVIEKPLGIPSKEELWVVINIVGKKSLVTKEGEEIYGRFQWDGVETIVEDEDMNTYAVVSKEGKVGLVTEDGEEAYGGCQREGIKSYILPSDYRERYWEVIKDKRSSSFVGADVGLVNWHGEPVYGEKWTDIKGFVTSPDGEIYLWVYNHADAYHLEGLVKKDGTEVFGGCRRHIKEVNFYKDKTGKLYLEVPHMEKKTKYIDEDGKEKGFMTRVEKI